MPGPPFWMPSARGRCALETYGKYELLPKGARPSPFAWLAWLEAHATAAMACTTLLNGLVLPRSLALAHMATPGQEALLSPLLRHGVATWHRRDMQGLLEDAADQCSALLASPGKVLLPWLGEFGMWSAPAQQQQQQQQQQIAGAGGMAFAGPAAVRLLSLVVTVALNSRVGALRTPGSVPVEQSVARALGSLADSSNPLAAYMPQPFMVRAVRVGPAFGMACLRCPPISAPPLRTLIWRF
jgi:hypothetical protein